MLHGDRSERDIGTELSLLIDGATNYAIYMLDPEGRVAIWNKGAERIKGWREDEVVGRSAEIFYLPEDIARGKMAADLAKARDSGRLEEESLRARKDGSRFLANVTITGLYAADGRFRGFGKVVRDITAQRAAEEAIAAREAQLAAILQTVPDAMIVTDADGRIQSFSTAAEAMFGYARGEVIGRPVDILYETPAAPPVPARGAPPSLPVRRLGRRKNGEIFPHEVTVGQVRLADHVLLITFLRDLTERERTASQLHALRSELLHVSRVSAMGTMATTLAHELHQPLTAIVNYTNAAQMAIERLQADDVDDLVEALQDASRQALRAGAIVRRLRDFVSRGEVDKRDCDLASLIEEAVALAGLAGLGVDIDYAFDPRAATVFVDRIQTQQLLTNLLRNAIDAMADTRHPRIVVSTTVEGDHARVTVADCGPGFAPGIRDRMFDFFAGTKADGMGMGLAICRTIVEAHGGRIWLDRAVVCGSTLHFTLPLATEVRDDGE